MSYLSWPELKSFSLSSPKRASSTHLQLQNLNHLSTTKKAKTLFKIVSTLLNKLPAPTTVNNFPRPKYSQSTVSYPLRTLTVRQQEKSAQIELANIVYTQIMRASSGQYHNTRMWIRKEHIRQKAAILHYY